MIDKAPYYSDYNAQDNHVYVLTKPTQPIQNRELIEIQRIANSQISKQGKHLFKYGSPLSGIRMSFEFINYVQLSDTSNIDSITDVDNVTIIGRNSKIKANLISLINSKNNDPKTLYINYTASGGNISNVNKEGNNSSNFDDTVEVGEFEFIEGEHLDFYVNGTKVNDNDDANGTNKAVVRCDCNGDAVVSKPLGKGRLFKFDGGEFWVDDFAITTRASDSIVSKYNSETSYHVGLNIELKIKDGNNEVSLFDNALGYANYNAKGADRLFYTASIGKRSIGYDTKDTFIILATIENGDVIYMNDKQRYNELGNTLATRTYDESGNYTVEPFKLVDILPHLRSDDKNNGYLTKDKGGDVDKFAIELSSGLAYVSGYRHDKVSNTTISLDRARESITQNNVYTNIGEWDSIIVTPTSNFTVIKDKKSSMLTAEFHSGLATSGAVSGTKLGECIAIQTNNLSDGKQQLFVTNIKLNKDVSFSDVKSIITTSNTPYVGNVQLNSLKGGDNNTLLFKLPFARIKSMKVNNTSDTSMFVRKTYNATTNSTGVVSITTDNGDVLSPYSTEGWSIGVESNGVYTLIPVSVANVSVNTNTATINIGTSHANKDVLVTAKVIYSTATSKIKTLSSNKQTFNNPVGETVINLPHRDLIAIKNIKTIKNGAELNLKEFYALDNGNTAHSYNNATITLKSGFNFIVDKALEIEVEYTYFNHSGSGSYFNVDSYSSIIIDNSNTFTYSDIPKVFYNEIEYNLADVLDFRTTTTSAGVALYSNEVPSVNDYIIADITHYQNRKDVIIMNELGEFKALKGTSGNDNNPPRVPKNIMGVYEVTIGAYTDDLQRDVSIRFIENKRYTMRDIGTLENRISNNETYNAFNLLNSSIGGVSVKDKNGLDRYRNGIAIDTFRDFYTGNPANKDWQCALDLSMGVLRPSHKAYSPDLKLVNSSNAKVNNDVITADYTEVTHVEQPFATKSISVQPYLTIATSGSLTLSPNIDNWSDTETQPKSITNLDLGTNRTTTTSNSTGIRGVTWGSWRDVSRNNATNSIITNSTRRGVSTTTSLVNREISLGSSVTSVNLIPFIRQRLIRFSLAGMKPNTRLYCFVDDTNITQYLHGAVNGILTDKNGNYTGLLTMPNNDAIKFTVGEKTIRFSNSNTNSKDIDNISTFAEAKYYANGISSTVRENVLSTRQTTINTNIINQSRTTRRRTGGNGVNRGRDPIAQSFIVDTDIFATSVDLFFSHAPENARLVEVSIVSMDNGLPSNVELPLSKSVKKANEINVSNDSSSLTNFKFDAPVFLKGGKQYAIMVFSESEACRCYLSKMGQSDIKSDIVINSQPTLGSFFASQNKETWDARQYEDLKININKAKFNTGEVSFQLEVENNNLLETLPSDPIVTTKDDSKVQIIAPSHGLQSGDLISVSINDRTRQYKALVKNGYPVSGCQVKLGTQYGVINTTQFVKKINDDYEVNISFSEVYGTLPKNQVLTASNEYQIDDENKTLVSSTCQLIFDTEVSNVVFSGFSSNDFIGKSVNKVINSDLIEVDMGKSATKTGSYGGSAVMMNKAVHYSTMRLDLNTLTFDNKPTYTYDGVSGYTVGGSSRANLSVINQDFDLGQDNNMPKVLLLPHKKSAVSNALTIKGKYTCNNEDVSPLIDLQTARLVLVTNRVSNEDKAIASYVTDVIKLKNQALSLTCIIDAMTVNNSRFDISYRVVKTGSDIDINKIEYTKFEGNGKVNSSNPTEYIEYRCDKEFEAIEDAFLQYQVKIDMYANNSASPPLFKGLRLLATT